MQAVLVERMDQIPARTSAEVVDEVHLAPQLVVRVAVVAVVHLAVETRVVGHRDQVVAPSELETRVSRILSLPVSVTVMGDEAARTVQVLAR